ncbi:uncharacterized protein LOC124309432 [Neodiprion virginianus]|uniref:uncharacterized protein LOC124309432 n=1 Tax=Neodiprion virginianus TaxID=2961670 RepID=UPI001EE6C41F|nr:uncharacterized protein LOC124309432 [Neodiprion virginianus]
MQLIGFRARHGALTRHMTPSISNASLPGKVESNTESMQTLVNAQNKLVSKILNVATNISSELLGSGAVKFVQGECKLKNGVLEKVAAHYQVVAWGAVSSILDHVVLWWSPGALATRHSQGALHLKDWLHQFIQASNVPPIVLPALQNLCDALGHHVTTTAWDQLFRSAYTSAFNCQSSSLSTEIIQIWSGIPQVYQPQKKGPLIGLKIGLIVVLLSGTTHIKNDSFRHI